MALFRSPQPYNRNLVLFFSVIAVFFFNRQPAPAGGFQASFFLRKVSELSQYNGTIFSALSKAKER